MTTFAASNRIHRLHVHTVRGSNRGVTAHVFTDVSYIVFRKFGMRKFEPLGLTVSGYRVFDIVSLRSGLKVFYLATLSIMTKMSNHYAFWPRAVMMSPYAHVNAFRATARSPVLAIAVAKAACPFKATGLFVALGVEHQLFSERGSARTLSFRHQSSITTGIEDAI